VLMTMFTSVYIYVDIYFACVFMYCAYVVPSPYVRAYLHVPMYLLTVITQNVLIHSSTALYVKKREETHGEA